MHKDHSPHLFKSFSLFLIALVLLITTAPFGFLYALVLDEAGNVVMQHLLNDTLLIKNTNTYYFGNMKETISSVIGKNSLTNTLSFLGKLLNNFLNFIDKGHSLNSIIYDVKLWEENKAN